jgi:cell wall-associated NlpC family hydrolase
VVELRVNLSRWWVGCSFVVAVAMTAPSSTPLTAQSESAFNRNEKPFATISRMFLGESRRDSLVQLATSQVGTKYRWGAASPGRAFDCSGLVQWLLSNFDLVVPRTSRDQARLGREIPKDPAVMLPGDLLYFADGRTVDHIGVYIGNGLYVHAANRRKGVVVSELPTGRSRDTWWRGVRRVFAHPEEIASISAQISPLLLNSGS